MKREKYLLSLMPEGLDYDSKYNANFEKYGTYLGNGVYGWKGLFADDTRILFLIGVLRSEGIEFENE